MEKFDIEITRRQVENNNNWNDPLFKKKIDTLNRPQFKSIKDMGIEIQPEIEQWLIETGQYKVHK